MKGLKQKLSWLLIITMIFSQASFAAFADSDDDDYEDYEVNLINDLYTNTTGGDRNLQRTVFSGQDLGNEVKEVKWTDAAPKVTTESMIWDSKKMTAYYANGQEITIVASDSDAATYIVEENGAYTELGENPYIYGGATASNASYDSTKITMNSGNVFAIVGSNRFRGTVKKTDITLNGGTVRAIHANEGSSLGNLKDDGTAPVWNDAGAAQFADSASYKVGEANIVINGGEVADKVDGVHGHAYTETFNLTINGGEIGTEAKEGSVMAGGTNGKMGTAVVNVNGGTLTDSISVGYRAYVEKATINLTSGTAEEIFAGSYYPDTEKSTAWIPNNWASGKVDYGKAEELEINIGENFQYEGLYAGFQLMQTEINKYNETYKDVEQAKTEIGFFNKPTLGAVKISVAAEPEITSGRDNILGAGYDTYKGYVELTLPSIKVTGGTASPSNADSLAIWSGDSLQVLPRTEVNLLAEEPNQDQKFTGWNGSVEFDDEKDSETTFTMPKGLVERQITAEFTDKDFALDVYEMTLDIYGEEIGEVNIDDFDYASPSVASYDSKIVTVTGSEDGHQYKIIPVSEGNTTVVFQAEGTSRTAELAVTVKDSTPVLTVKGGTIVTVGEDTLPEGITTRKVEGKKAVVLKADSIDDKKFIGWSGVKVAEDGSFMMPDSDTTVTAQFEDKVFQFEEGTDREVTLNVDQTETNTDKTPDSYTFRIESDYTGDRIAVSSTDKTSAAVTENADGSYTVKAVSAGMVTVQAAVTRDSGEVTMLDITVNVADTTRKTEAENGKAEINADNVETEVPDLPDGIDQEQADALEEELKTKVTEAITSIVTNEAAKEGVSGFSTIPESALLAAGIPAGANVMVYPKQELKKVETVFEATKTVDPVTNVETVTYTPVIKRIVFDIKPYAASNTGSGTEKVLSGLRGNFRFRIPVPSTISASARYAKLTHRSDQSGAVVNDQYLTIQEDGGSKYVTVTTTHFSTFELEFTDSKPSSGGGSGGGGGGGSRTTSAAGKWVQNATGWWYQYADNTYPAGKWLYIDGFANGTQWCHFDAAGYLQTGWFTDADGQRYYLHPIGDGSRGYMYTGWHEIDGKWYYFTAAKTETNPAGSLLLNTTTPDGYQVGADGARIQQ